MSEFVKEIIEDLKNNPKTFKDYFGMGAHKENLIVYLYGNSKFLSIIKVSINGKEIPTSFFDRWRLEVAIKIWYRKATLKMLSE